MDFGRVGLSIWPRRQQTFSQSMRALRVVGLATINLLVGSSVPNQRLT